MDAWNEIGAEIDIRHIGVADGLEKAEAHIATIPGSS